MAPAVIHPLRFDETSGSRASAAAIGHSHQAAQRIQRDRPMVVHRDQHADLRCLRAVGRHQLLRRRQRLQAPQGQAVVMEAKTSSGSWRRQRCTSVQPGPPGSSAARLSSGRAARSPIRAMASGPSPRQWVQWRSSGSQARGSRGIGSGGWAMEGRRAGSTGLTESSKRLKYSTEGILDVGCLSDRCLRRVVG